MARENWTTFTPVLPATCELLRTSARATPSAIDTALAGFSACAVMEIIGASGEVAACTLLRRVSAVTPAHTWASPVTAMSVATRPYAWAKPSAAAGSDFSAGTTMT